MTDSVRLESTIYVAGLEFAINERILADVFLPFGEIVEITLPKPELPSSTDAHRGFGYIEFDVPGDAKEAIENMDQSELYGRVIKVAQAKPQKDKGDGLGSKRAIWDSTAYLAKHTVSEEDKRITGRSLEEHRAESHDRMQGLEVSETAGPQPIG